jgi:hypothetical protein
VGENLLDFPFTVTVELAIGPALLLNSAEIITGSEGFSSNSPSIVKFRPGRTILGDINIYELKYKESY